MCGSIRSGSIQLWVSMDLEDLRRMFFTDECYDTFFVDFNLLDGEFSRRFSEGSCTTDSEVAFLHQGWTCTHVHTCTRTHAHTHARAHTRTDTHTHAHTHAHAQTRTCTHTHTGGRGRTP